MGLIGLTKEHGERVLVNPDQIIYIEVGGGNKSNIYLARDMVRVIETVTEIEALLGGSAVVPGVGPKEFKEVAVSEQIDLDDLTVPAADESDLTTEGINETALADVLADEPPNKKKNR